MENPHFRPRRPPDMIPGAVAIVQHGYEEDEIEGEEWDPTAPSHINEAVEQAPLRAFTRTYIDATVTPLRKNLQEMSTTRMILYSILLMVIMGGVGAGIAIAVTSSDDSATPASPTVMCDFSNAAQPDPILQCECNGNITVLNEELLLSYEDLLQTFIPSLYPEGINHYVDSCEPQNVALLWLAMDEEKERSPVPMARHFYLWFHKDHLILK